MNFIRFSLLIVCCLWLFLFSWCSKKNDISEPKKEPIALQRLYNNPRVVQQINEFCGWHCKDNYDQYLSYEISDSQQQSWREIVIEISAKPLYQSSFPGIIVYTFKEQQINGKNIISLRHHIDGTQECLENCNIQPGLPSEVTESIMRKYGDLEKVSWRVPFSESFYQWNYYIARARLSPEDYIRWESINLEPPQLFVGYWSGWWIDLYQGNSEEISCEILEQVNYPKDLLEQYQLTCISWANHSIPIKTKEILWIPYTLPDIVWQVIPTGQDITIFVSNYLKGQGIYNYVIEQQKKKWDIITISMKPHSDFWCHFEAGWCIIFLLKDRTIIWSNATSYLECTINVSCSSWHWRFYRYTDHGILLEIQNGEGLGCIDGITYTYQYINLKDLKTLWSTLDIIKQWTSPDPTDERCQNPKTVWKEAQKIEFFSSYENVRNGTSLNIEAKTTEEAYYKYYNQ